MANTPKMIRLPAHPGIALKQIELTAGYEFGKPKGGKVDIIHTKTQAKTATIHCGCLGSGGCKITIVAKFASCTEDGCKPGCAFVVSVPSDAFAGHLGDVFKP